MPWPSGPANIVELQEAIPETESVPWKLRPTGWLYQPLWSGGRSGLNETTVGGVRSIPIQTFLVSLDANHSTVQRRSTALISPVKVAGVQPLTRSGVPPGSQYQEMDTSDVLYQRLQ